MVRKTEDEKITNYTLAFIKWKCAHCGKIEYRSTMFGAPYKGVCKKGKKQAYITLGILG